MAARALEAGLHAKLSRRALVTYAAIPATGGSNERCLLMPPTLKPEALQLSKGLRHTNHRSPAGFSPLGPEVTPVASDRRHVRHEPFVGWACSGAPTSSSGEWPDMMTAARTLPAGSNDAAVIIAVQDCMLLPDVRGAVDNARAWNRYLIEDQRIPETRVQLVTDGAATAERIRMDADAGTSFKMVSGP